MSTRIFVTGFVFRCCVAITSFFLSIPLFANDSTTNIDDVARYLDESEQAIRNKFEKNPDVFLTPEKLSKDMQFPDESNCFPIQEIVIEPASRKNIQTSDASFINTLPKQLAWLQEDVDEKLVVEEGNSLCLGVGAIKSLISQLQQRLIYEGFVTTQLGVPAQNLNSRKLVLSLLVGRIGEIRFAEGVPSRATYKNALLTRAGDILNLRDIEQALENFQRVPSVTADIKIAPAKRQGHSDLIIEWKQADPLRVDLSLNDSGNTSTGKHQGSVTISYDPHWAWNDYMYLTISGNQTNGRRTWNNGTDGTIFHYSIPFGYWLLSATVSQNSYFFTQQGSVSEIEETGESRSQEFKLSNVAYRDARSKVSIYAKAFAKQSKSFTNGTEKVSLSRRIGGWEAGASYRRFIDRAILNLEFLYQRGTDAFGARPIILIGSNFDYSHYELAQANASISVPFVSFERPFRYTGKWSGQYNYSPLDSRQYFSIGSRYTVRGFDETVNFSSEKGWYIRNDVSMPFGDQKQSAFLALDYGQLRGGYSSTTGLDHLTGIACGIKGQLLPNVQYELLAAKSIKQPQKTKSDDTVYGFQLSASF